jgi:hypothetical protein
VSFFSFPYEVLQQKDCLFLTDHLFKYATEFAGKKYFFDFPYDIPVFGEQKIPDKLLGNG